MLQQKVQQSSPTPAPYCAVSVYSEKKNPAHAGLLLDARLRGHDN
jgi:hypothetical protein